MPPDVVDWMFCCRAWVSLVNTEAESGSVETVSIRNSSSRFAVLKKACAMALVVLSAYRMLPLAGLRQLLRA